MFINTEKLLFETINLMPIEPALLFAGDDLNLTDTRILNRLWSGVYTTQSTNDITRGFYSEKRRIFEVLPSEDWSAVKLNRTNMPFVRLCGVSHVASDPISIERFQLEHMSSISNLIRDYGHIFVAGHFDEGLIKNFCLQILSLKRKQIVLFFGLSDAEKSNVYINRLIEEDKAVIIDKNLNDAINYIYEQLEEYDFDSEISDDKGAITIYINGKPISVNSGHDREVLLNVKSFATLLNVNEVERSDCFPSSETTQRFASFLQSSTTGFPRWYAYRENNSFHIYRYFEESLFKKTQRILADASTKERKAKPIMLRGQACCGKTNALGALAYRIFNEKKNPVVYIPESDINFHINIEKDVQGNVVKKKTSDYESLEMLIRRIEEKTDNPVPTLIIWDTACRTKSELRKASDLLFSLREDGRQVQIVCSGYNSTQNGESSGTKQNYTFIDVDIFLHNNENCNEVDLIRQLLIDKGGFQPIDADKYMRQYSASENFFASLYMFRELHVELKKRLRRENESRIEDMSEAINRLSKESANKAVNEVMAIQINKALEKFGWQLTPDSENVAEERISIIKERLTDIVCCVAFCTIYKEKLPVSIIVRMLADTDIITSELFNVIMNNSLLVHSISPDSDEPNVNVRSELEAKLILEAYNKNKMDIVLSLLDYISPNSNMEEVKLIQNIIQLIGPNNKNSSLSLWKPECQDFETLINKLSYLRENSHCDDLILQEITLSREVYKVCKWLDDEQRKKKIFATINLAKEFIDGNGNSELNGFLANLFVEWALLCARYSDMDATYSKKIMYDEVTRNLKKVINRFPKNGYAYSAYLWAGLTYAKSLSDNDDYKYDLLQDLSSLRDIVENELKDDDFDENVLGEIDGLLDGLNFSNERFERSISNGKAYGLYFKIREIRVSGEEKLDYNMSLGNTESSLKKCEQIIKLLTDERYHEIVYSSSACLYALINAEWLFNTKEPIIPVSENVCVGLTTNKWTELYSSCRTYLDEVSTIRTSKIVYLLALCAAHLDEHRNECQELFDEIRNAEWFERRTLHLICDEKKNPLKFNGRLNGKYNVDKNRGYIQLDAVGLTNPVFFRADRIGQRAELLRENMQLRDLSLATSFSGFQICRV